MQHSPISALAFQADPLHKQKYYADLYLLARQRLTACGVKHIYGGDFCTYTQKDLFFSYRRDGQTGRMAHVIWRE